MVRLSQKEPSCEMSLWQKSLLLVAMEKVPLLKKYSGTWENSAVLSDMMQFDVIILRIFHRTRPTPGKTNTSTNEEAH